MSTRVWVPGDAAALAVGADSVVHALRTAAQTANKSIEILRNGSRGAYWLEPLIEIETAAGRIAYGPVSAADVADLVASGLLDGRPHRRCLGDVSQSPWFARQQRLTCQRIGLIEPSHVDQYRAIGGYSGLRRALTMAPEAIVKEIVDSGLRGRGGAAFPTGIKWRTVLDQSAAQKYIACNADEGDSGTFADRLLMEGDPLALLEGMTIAGIAVGAAQGFIYLRIEYPHAYRMLGRAIEAARAAGWLGPNIQGSGKSFDIEIRLGAGAYICGEETSMLESLEGKRGEVRVRPPLPAIKGLFGQPTVVNNVVTLATVPTILSQGAARYRDFGAGQSRGTIPLQLAGNIKRGGLIEVAFGLSIRELIEEFGGGTASGRPALAVQIGGPLGAYVPAAQFDLKLDYETLAAADAMLGHGGVVVFDDTTDMAAMARYALEFCAIESCGKCTPCRIGSTRGVELLDRIRVTSAPAGELALLEELCDTMVAGSLCGLGGMAPFPVRSAIKYFPEHFGRRS